MLDKLLPLARLVEVDRVELGAPPARVWQLIRHENLARSPLVRALFAIRAIPERLHGKREEARLCLDDLASSPGRPGFQILGEDPPREIVVGAIGKVWHLEIPFVHVVGAEGFAAFREPGFVKVAWAIRLEPLGEDGSRLELEVRVDATDDDSFRHFRRYFRLIGPGSHFIRKTLLAWLAREFGTPDARGKERQLAGDDLLPDAAAEVTHGITLAAPPERVWPWLLQLGCRRAGFYSYDVLDNGGARSAREVHPELQELYVGQVLPADPESDEGFEVLRIEPTKALVLGGLFDPEKKRQLPFAAERPRSFWHVTWAFVLEPVDEGTTRLHVRARAAFAENGRLHAAWIRPVHSLMQADMLRNLKARVEGSLARDDYHDVLEGLGGVALMMAAFLSPFLRDTRRHWGLSEETAARAYPGDDLVPHPRWSWTHGIEIDAAAEEVWPWVAQVGADRAGFYSYQWLENIVGCDVKNAETLHPDWRPVVGQQLLLHPAPEAPRLEIAAVEPGRWFVAFARADEQARTAGRPWAAASWLFHVEPLGPDRCRLVSRHRAACSEDLATRLAAGPTLLEPVAFAMDRRMLLGVKERAERRSAGARLSRTSPPAGAE